MKATQSAAERYRIANVKDVVGRGAKAADPCPTVALLREKKEISATAKDVDAWETPLRLTCNDPFKAETIEVIVTSAGPDRKFDTADDISAGPPK